MEETNATLRTFSQEKYDAMEANIPYQEKHILKKKKTENIQLLTIATIMVITIIILCIRDRFSINNESLPSRTLYKTYEDTHYKHDVNFHQETTVPSIKSIRYDSLLHDFYNITLKTNDENTFKYKYYKLIEVCIPHLRRR